MKLKTKFQDEDFDFGEVVDGVIVECLGKHEEKLRVIATAAKGGQHTFYYSSIRSFMDDWEDAPTEEVWYLGERIGNYSMPKKEARKATEKILAWKRLKDKGFRFNGIEQFTHIMVDEYTADKTEKEYIDDLMLLFGGEE